MPKFFTRKSRPRLILYIMGVLILVVLAVQSLFIWNLYTRTDQIGNEALKTALIDSIRGLNTELAIEPTTGKEFIPASRVFFPPHADHRLLYRGGDGSDLWFIDASNQAQAVSKIRTAQSLSAIFAGVELTQACGRQVVVSFDKADPEIGNSDKLILATTKKLKDGRLAYIYENRKCSSGNEAILRHVKQIESF